MRHLWTYEKPTLTAIATLNAEIRRRTEEVERLPVCELVRVEVILGKPIPDPKTRSWVTSEREERSVIFRGNNMQMMLGKIEYQRSAILKEPELFGLECYQINGDQRQRIPLPGTCPALEWKG